MSLLVRPEPFATDFTRLFDSLCALKSLVRRQSPKPAIPSTHAC